MERKRGQTIRSEARNIIRHVIRKCDEEAQNGAMLHLPQQANLRASFYTGISTRTISRIRKEDSTCRDDEPLPTPGTKRPKSEDKKFHCSLEDQAVIRGVIYDFYLEKKIMPTGPKILAAIREKINFPWEINSLYRLLRCMGFEWKKTISIKKVLIEKPKFVVWRAKYLKSIEYYRKQNRSIIYIDETWVDKTLYFHKCWHGKEIGIVKNTNSSSRLVIIHAGGKDGFIKEAELIFESQTTPSDIHGQMNAANFEIWITEKLLPNIPPNSVVVMDNAPYHSARLNKPPSKYSKKEHILQWLVENNIPYAQNMRKYQLLELIDRRKKSRKTFKVDEILKVHGHNALRLPPSMSDLNPIELAWSQVKKKLKEKNIFVSSSSELEKHIMEAINEITQKDWQNFCEQVEKLEGDYWRKDGLVEEITDNLELASDESESDSDESIDSED